jgi:hypothetical protein
MINRAEAALEMAQAANRYHLVAAALDELGRLSNNQRTWKNEEQAREELAKLCNCLGVIPGKPGR